MSETFVNQANEILKKYPKLQIGGFYERDKETQWNFKRVEVMKEYILNNWISVPPRSRKYTRSSYGLKHVLEESNWTEDQDKYVANGEFILAMMCAGYMPGFQGLFSDSPNCYFKVDTQPKQAQLQRVLEGRLRVSESLQS
jgi:hypothetical protein